MNWSEVADDIWSIPAERTKTGNEHRAPLGVLALDILEAQPRYAGTDLVFPGRGLRPLSGWTQILRPMKEALGDQKFAFHALRRSYRTGLTRIGVDFDLAELMIAHARSDLHRRYDHSDRWAERDAAQSKWEAYLANVTGGA